MIWMQIRLSWHVFVTSNSSKKRAASGVRPPWRLPLPPAASQEAPKEAAEGAMEAAPNGRWVLCVTVFDANKKNLLIVFHYLKGLTKKMPRNTVEYLFRSRTQVNVIYSVSYNPRCFIILSSYITSMSNAGKEIEALSICSKKCLLFNASIHIFINKKYYNNIIQEVIKSYLFMLIK